MTVLIQRPLKGSRISSFYPVKTLPPLSALDSAFQLQEYISLLIRLDVHDVDRIISIPGKNAAEGQDNGDAKGDEKDEKDGASNVNVDEACWVYEQLRRLAQDLSHPLITMLQQECTRSTCPEMKAGEWLYLCVAHGNEGAMEQCCAIDYILHTLDSATALLNSPRAFPSRLSVPPASNRHFSSLARRLGRIFAHAYFHHREAFEQAEAESSLYARFLALTSKFDLVPAEFLVIPPRLTAMSDDERSRGDHVEPPRLLAASLDPRRDLGRDDRAWPDPDARGSDRGTSPTGAPGQRGNESPRKFGRNRTDTMVYSEAFSIAEELAKGDFSEVDIDREIAAERASAAVDADLPSATAPLVPEDDTPYETQRTVSEEVKEPQPEAQDEAQDKEEDDEDEEEEDEDEDEEEEESQAEEPPEAAAAQEPILILVPSRSDSDEAGEQTSEEAEAPTKEAQTPATEAQDTEETEEKASEPVLEQPAPTDASALQLDDAPETETPAEEPTDEKQEQQETTEVSDTKEPVVEEAPAAEAAPAAAESAPAPEPELEPEQKTEDAKTAEDAETGKVEVEEAEAKTEAAAEEKEATPSTEPEAATS